MTLVPGAFKLLFPRSAVPCGIHTRVRSHLGHPFHLLPLSVTLDKIPSAEYVSSAESKARGAGVDIGRAIEFRREPSVERNLHQKVERQRSDDDTGFDHRRPQSGSPGLHGFLELDPALEVVGEAENGEEAVELARRFEPDVVLMDLLMPVMDGIEATRVIRRELPEVEVVALTSVLEDASVTGAVRAGAIGYLLKTTDADELCEAIKSAAAGQVQLAPEAAARLMREARASENPEALTERETEVLMLIARGKANKQIARALHR